MGKLGTYNSGQLLNSTGHFLLWFHKSEKKVPRHNELRCSQLFCRLLWALSRQQPWGCVSEMRVWLWDDWIASHSLVLRFRAWSVQWPKIHKGTVSRQIEPHVPCKVVESTDFEAGGFSPSGKALASGQRSTCICEEGACVSACSVCSSPSLARCTCELYSGLLALLESWVAMWFSFLALITDSNYMSICEITLLRPGSCTP